RSHASHFDRCAATRFSVLQQLGSSNSNSKSATWRSIRKVARGGCSFRPKHKLKTANWSKIGPHVLFEWKDAQPIGCSKGELKDLSLSVKGEGGYIVIPPSVRKGRAYTVHRDIDPILAPQWLTDLILLDPTSGGRKGKQKRGPT